MNIFSNALISSGNEKTHTDRSEEKHDKLVASNRRWRKRGLFLLAILLSVYGGGPWALGALSIAWPDIAGSPQGGPVRGLLSHLLGHVSAPTLMLPDDNWYRRAYSDFMQKRCAASEICRKNAETPEKTRG